MTNERLATLFKPSLLSPERYSMSTPTFDPWTQVQTLRGFPADEIISALQKEIRRGNVENAVLIANEMIETSPELEQKLWDRLCVISVEDVGFGDVQAPVLVATLRQMTHHFHRGEGDRALFAIHAVRFLALARKDRSSDEMYNWVRDGTANGTLGPIVPDYAVDMHTARGAAMGRGFHHFFTEGAHVAPELADRDTTYRERILASLEAQDADLK
jgi:replication-associated recombination protein RarA